MAENDVAFAITSTLAQTVQKRQIGTNLPDFHRVSHARSINRNDFLNTKLVVMDRCTVNSIKISYKIKTNDAEKLLHNFAQDSSHVTKVRSNFFVLRNQFVYVIFFSGHVNGMKLKTDEDIANSQNCLRDCLTNCELTTPVIDNIAASGILRGSSINLFKFSEFLEELKIPHHFNPQSFPGLNLRIGSVTFVVFASNKYLAVGSKTRTQLENGCRTFEEYVSRFNAVLRGVH